MSPAVVIAAAVDAASCPLATPTCAAVTMKGSEVAQIRDDLPLMARLCLALVAEESRLAGVVEQRKEDLEARGRDHALQDALTAIRLVRDIHSAR